MTPAPADGSVLTIPAARAAQPSGAAPAAPAGASPNPWVMAHQALRGRYGPVLFAALLCAACGAAAGWWKGGKAVYRSEGLIRFPSSRQETVWRAQSYDVFMQSQVVRMTSRGMVELALQQPAWAATKRGASDSIVRAFADSLSAEVKPRTEYIRVMYTDEDSKAAAAAVRSVITAYEQRFNAERTDEGRMGPFVSERDAVAAEVRRLDGEVRTFVDEFHTTNLDPICDEVQTRIAKLRGTLADILMALGVARPSSPPAAGSSSYAPVAGVDTPSPERIAMVDAIMQRYLDDERHCEDHLADLKDRFGDAHPEVTRASQSLDRAKARVRQHAEEFVRYMAETGSNPFARPGQPSVSMTARPREELLSDQHAITELLEQAQAEAKHDGESRYRLQGIMSELKTKREELEEKNKHLTALESAAAQADGMEVLSYGETPLTPFLDHRQRLAAAGGVVGAGAPVGLLVGLSLLRRRYRYSDDTASGSARETPLLGILPELNGNSAEVAAVAAQNIHQMRVMLQVTSGQDGKHAAYLVSSACAAEGKTSVVAALGLSFAASGARTVLVDGDLVGRALTRSFRAQSYSGLREAITGRTLRGHLRKTLLLPQLVLLSAGRDASPLDASTVSPEGIRWLMGHLRQYFDVVLVDSGPVLGSVEASLFAREVDGVVFVISRGQQQDVVERAAARMSSLGANLKGFVFNRARHRDFIRSIQVSSYRPRNELPTGSRELSLADARRASVGPLADAVLASVRAP